MTLDDWATRQAVADAYVAMFCRIVRLAIADIKNRSVTSRDRESARSFLTDPAVVALIEAYIGPELADALGPWVEATCTE